MMAIHEHLTPIRKRELEQIGWTKARELAKVARRDRQAFESAPWVHKANTMPKEEFKREVERYLTGKDTEAWEIRKRHPKAVLTSRGVCYAVWRGWSTGMASKFHGRSSSMRLIGWSAMQDNTLRRYASGSRPLSLAVPIRL